MLRKRSTRIRLLRVTVTKARVHAESQVRTNAGVGELLDHIRRTDVHMDVVLFHKLNCVVIEDVGRIDNLRNLLVVFARLVARTESSNDFSGADCIYDCAGIADNR